MSNFEKPARVGWVHPKNATGPNAKEAALEAGAGNITDNPPGFEEVSNPRPSISQADYPAPRDDGAMADAKTAGNYEGITPPYAPLPIPAGGKPPGQKEE